MRGTCSAIHCTALIVFPCLLFHNCTKLMLFAEMRLLRHAECGKPMLRRQKGGQRTALVAPVQVASPCFPLLCHQKRSAVRCRMQRAAVTDAAHCDDRCSVLRFPSHSKAVLWGGFLSIQAFGFLLLPHPFGKVLSVFLCHAGQCLLLRWTVRLVARAFRVLLCESVPSAAWFCALSCADLYILLREPMAWQVWVAAVEMTWGWDREAWGCGPGLPGWRVRGNRQVR